MIIISPNGTKIVVLTEMASEHNQFDELNTLLQKSTNKTLQTYLSISCVAGIDVVHFFFYILL